MARLPVLPLLLCLSGFVTVQSVMYQLKGQQVQFDPDITGQPDEILWKHNGNKVVEYSGSEEKVFGSYEGRVTLDWDSAQLQISDLRLEDSGEYEYEIYMNRLLQRKSYKLGVIDKVAKPTITCQMNSRSSSNVSAVLLCSVELNQPQSSVNFTWVSGGNVQHGPQLTIFLGAELDEEEYTCRVNNLLSNETATFRAKDCNTDAGSSAGMVAFIVVIVIVIFCVGSVILLRKLKHKGSAGRNEEQVQLKDIEQTPNTKDSEREDRGAQSNAGGVLHPAAQQLSPPTQNSPDMAAQDAVGEDNKDVNVASESGSSLHKNQNKSNDFDNNVQSSTTTEHRGSKQPAEALRVYPRF